MVALSPLAAPYSLGMGGVSEGDTQGAYFRLLVPYGCGHSRNRAKAAGVRLGG